MNPIAHRYRYSWFMQLFTIIFDIFGLIFPIYFIIFPLFRIIIYHETVNFLSLISLLLYSISAGMVFILVGNFFTEIVSDKEGLHIRFLWRNINVPWEDIIDLKPIFTLPFIKRTWVVRTRTLTSFHRLYGLLYSFSPSPSLICTKDISNFEELTRRIRASSLKNRNVKLCNKNMK